MRIHPGRDATAEAGAPYSFTGSVWRTVHLPRVGDGMVGHRFVYGPGARSFWHVHDGEQALVATDGRGLATWDGLTGAVAMLPGDWLHVDPGIEHWHGAARDASFTHLAVTTSGDTHWLGPVSDADYLRAHRALGWLD